MLVGIAIGVGYYLYLLHEMSGKPQAIRVSLMLPFLSLLLVANGTMQLTLDDAKTTRLMSFDASNLSKRDLMVAAVVVVGMLGVMVGLALFLDAHGYRGGGVPARPRANPTRLPERSPSSLLSPC